MKKTTLIIIAIIAFVIGGIYLLGRGSVNTANGSLIGKQAPAFSLQDANGNTYNLEALKGKNIILFFNEGLMCYPACWNQMVELGKDKRFQDKNTEAFSVMVDSQSSWQNAIQKMPELAQSRTLFDTKGLVARNYGMLTMGSSMHFGQLPGHTYVLIDANGVVRYVYDDPTMSINNDKILSEIDKLNTQ